MTLELWLLPNKTVSLIRDEKDTTHSPPPPERHILVLCSALAYHEGVQGNYRWRLMFSVASEIVEVTTYQNAKMSTVAVQPMGAMTLIFTNTSEFWPLCARTLITLHSPSPIIGIMYCPINRDLKLNLCNSLVWSLVSDNKNGEQTCTTLASYPVVGRDGGPIWREGWIMWSWELNWCKIYNHRHCLLHLLHR